jgi:hypothetical protein
MELQVLAIFRPLKSLAFVSDFCMKTTDICHYCLRSIPRCCGDSEIPHSNSNRFSTIFV